jgi:glycosyltransferase 2 family protein
MTRRTRVVVGTAVSAVVLAALLWFTDPREIWQSLSRADLKWVALAVAINIATVPVMAWRWQLLLAAKRLQVPLGWLTRTYFVALFIGQFLPAAVGGDAVRAVELGRRTQEAPEAVASVLIDRLVGMVSLVALAVVAYAAGGHAAGGPEVIAAEAMFGAAAVVVLALLFSARLRGLAARYLEPRVSGRQLAAGQRFYEALHGYREHRVTLAAVCGLALIVQIARVGTIWMLVQALNLDVPLTEIYATGPVLFAALILPVSLNGIGVREAVFVSFLRDSTTPEQAIALGVLFFAVGAATALVGAAILALRWMRYGASAVRPRTRIDGETGP